MLCSLGVQPIFGKTLKRPSLLTRSYALVRSMKAMHKGMHAVLCTSLVAVEGRRPCLLLTVQLGNHIVTAGRYAPPASGGVLV